MFYGIHSQPTYFFTLQTAKEFQYISYIEDHYYSLHLSYGNTMYSDPYCFYNRELAEDFRFETADYSL